MGSQEGSSAITIGVLALQGAFNEHVQLLREAAQILATKDIIQRTWTFKEIRNKPELDSCDALIIPGGESTAISLVAQRCNMLEPLRDFVKVIRKPTWGTCAGLILLAEAANATKKGGQELIGGLDVRVNRNHFGRQIESFQADLNLPFLQQADGKDFDTSQKPFRAIFIRAPIVEKVLPHVSGAQTGQASLDETVTAPSRTIDENVAKGIKLADVEIMATLPGRAAAVQDDKKEKLDAEAGDIIAVRQANVFGTSFHPELTGDPRIHVWWLEQVSEAVDRRRALAAETAES
ncbi:Class I glutamine amidotransferase-like protein [Glarea lozoyensis ATCC 20868]|uniref:glutaminase n=1 Tax=Glarea lozoyensis (strain ATCC 20868 / MF5171) TaxID=1116229 RepID=S3CUN7_GLAL2|nr:Class I glutamine amidotransferase-like protein [Glarea lozoyensis ATCC 20868]EPE28704.1 Class I glutamine amidotransferase-like protein [Glarea lozoyensis ATCC 20868]